MKNKIPNFIYTTYFRHNTFKLGFVFLDHTAVERRTNKLSIGDKSIYLDSEKTGTTVQIIRSHIQQPSSAEILK
jgi:hypothetical protein